MKKLVLTIIVLAVLVGGGYWVYTVLNDDDSGQQSSSDTDTTTESPVESETPTTTEQPATNFTFSNPVKSAHYVSNTPPHGTTLDAVPEQVAINFNFDLAEPSSISITRDGRDAGSGSTTISANKLVLSRAVTASSGSGLYTVNYTACWPDGSCHDGQFQFGVRQ